MSTYPRETVEYVFFDEVTVDGLPVTEFEYAVTRGLERPLFWNLPLMVEGRRAFQLDGTFLPGDYKVWVRVISAGGEQPVIQAGKFQIA